MFYCVVCAVIALSDHIGSKVMFSLIMSSYWPSSYSPIRSAVLLPAKLFCYPLRELYTSLSDITLNKCDCLFPSSFGNRFARSRFCWPPTSKCINRIPIGPKATAVYKEHPSTCTTSSFAQVYDRGCTLVNPLLHNTQPVLLKNIY